jgi:aspartate oxidase
VISCHIGSGIAGLCYALHASRYGSVIMITKKRDSESNTNHAQGESHASWIQKTVSKAISKIPSTPVKV